MFCKLDKQPSQKMSDAKGDLDFTFKEVVDVWQKFYKDALFFAQKCKKPDRREVREILYYPWVFRIDCLFLIFFSFLDTITLLSSEVYGHVSSHRGWFFRDGLYGLSGAVGIDPSEKVSDALMSN